MRALEAVRDRAAGVAAVLALYLIFQVLGVAALGVLLWLAVTA
jgi:hypothetical protein